MNRWHKWSLGILGGLVVAFGALAIFFDWNWLRGTLTEKVSAATGRHISVGDLQGQWSLTPTFAMRDVHVANADWGKAEELLSAEELEVTVDLPELLRGRTVLPQIKLVKPDLALEVREDGQTNWTLAAEAAAEAAAPEERSEVPLIGRLDIQDGRLRYSDPKHGLELDGQLNTAVAEGGKGKTQLGFTGSGTLQKEKFQIAFVGGSLLSLRENEEPYPVSLDIQAVDSHANISGTLVEPVKMDGLDLRARLQGPNLSKLTTITGIPLPITPPYDLAGRLEREGNVWKLTGLDGTMGHSDLRGDLRIDLTRERKFIEADLNSHKLDYRDVGSLIGIPPDAGEDKQAASKQRAKVAPKDALNQKGQKVEKPAEPRRVLPDAPLSVAQVRAVDAKVKFRGNQVDAPNVPLSGVQLDLELDNGVLHLKPLQVGVAGGRTVADIRIDARKEPVRTDYDVRLRGFELGDFMAKAGLKDSAHGRIDGRVRLTGTGNTVASSLGTSNGDIRLLINSGEISNLAIEVAGLDIAETLGLLATKDKPVGIRCFVADLGVDKGVASPRLFLMDTTDSTVQAEGRIDLRNELLDLRVKTQPKDPSVLAVRTPVTIKGAFAGPSIGVEKGPLAARGAAAVALGVLLTPVASILAFIEPGLGKDSDCAALLNEVQEPANVKSDSKVEAPRTASPGIPGRKPDLIPRQ